MAVGQSIQLLGTKKGKGVQGKKNVMVYLLALLVFADVMCETNIMPIYQWLP
jgi:hypothetical protein